MQTGWQNLTLESIRNISILTFRFCFDRPNGNFKCFWWFWYLTSIVIKRSMDMRPYTYIFISSLRLYLYLVRFSMHHYEHEKVFPARSRADYRWQAHTQVATLMLWADTNYPQTWAEVENTKAGKECLTYFQTYHSSCEYYPDTPPPRTRAVCSLHKMQAMTSAKWDIAARSMRLSHLRKTGDNIVSN